MVSHLLDEGQHRIGFDMIIPVYLAVKVFIAGPIHEDRIRHCIVAKSDMLHQRTLRTEPAAGRDLTRMNYAAGPDIDDRSRV